MEAKRIYQRLMTDFIRDGITDMEWAARMPGLSAYLTSDFKQSGMGVMCDFTNRVERVFTTVFLSDKVMETVLAANVENAMIFSHHPTNWSIAHHGGNYAATERYIAQLRERHISVFVLHHPLDHYSKYSTGKTLADALGIGNAQPNFLYCGIMCGVVGMTEYGDVHALHKHMSNVIGHKTSVYAYGQSDLRGEKIAICPGGGNVSFVVEEMRQNNIHTLITGVTLVNDYSKEVHTLEKRNGINVLGGTHYSTEKYAPMAMCGYFRDFGLPAEFIADIPDLYDL